MKTNRKLQTDLESVTICIVRLRYSTIETPLDSRNCISIYIVYTICIPTHLYQTWHTRRECRRKFREKKATMSRVNSAAAVGRVDNDNL